MTVADFACTERAIEYFLLVFLGDAAIAAALNVKQRELWWKNLIILQKREQKLLESDEGF